MSSIAAANSSAGEALVLLPRSGPAVGVDATASSETDTSAKSSGGPATVVDLSDRAKAVLERNKGDKIVAEQLQQQVAAAKGNDKPGSTSNSTPGDTSKIFDVLNSGSRSHPTDLPSLDPNLDRDAYLNALINANRQPDGTVKSFSKTVSDAFAAPSTPAEVDEWYKTQGQLLIASARQFGEVAATGIIQAVQNRTITISDAKDVPDLNFHNTIAFAGGEGGSSINGTSSWNHDAAIFKDPTTNTRVMNGYVISWQKPQGDAAIGVDLTKDPIFQTLPPIRF
jgi:hypothetical protein